MNCYTNARYMNHDTQGGGRAGLQKGSKLS
jgi:hypothetical protein